MARLVRYKDNVYAQYRKTRYFCDELGNIYKAYRKGLLPVKSYYHKTVKKWVVHLTYNDGSRDEIQVSRMVWESWNGLVPTGYYVCHKNGCKSMNDLNNLQLLTKKKLGEVHGWKTGKTKWVLDKDTGKIYRGTRNASKELGVSRQTISDICNGKRKNDNGVHVSWYDRKDKNR